MRRKCERRKDKTVGYGYVGEWNDGAIGWCLPTHLTACPGINERPKLEPWNVGEPTYLCKVTIERVKDSRGRDIVRRIKP